MVAVPIAVLRAVGVSGAWDGIHSRQMMIGGVRNRATRCTYRGEVFNRTPALGLFVGDGMEFRDYTYMYM